VGSLTQLERSIIIGSLLGDGYLRIVSGRANALLEINHSISQKEYVDWKFEMLSNICKSGPKSRKGNGARIAYRFTTRQHPELTDFYRMFYINQQKRIPDLILDPIMLAIWYMDDGSKCRDSDVYLNTQQFCVEDQQKLLRMIKVLDIECSLNRDKNYWRIRIKKSSIHKFFSIIERYIIASMMYKLSYNPVETCSDTRAECSQHANANTPPPLIKRMMI